MTVNKTVNIYLYQIVYFYTMKKVLIIGASSGIGQALAELFLQDDYMISVTGRREMLLQKTVILTPQNGDTDPLEDFM